MNIRAMNFYEFINRKELEEIRMIKEFTKKAKEIDNAKEIDKDIENVKGIDEEYRYPGNIPEEYILDTNEIVQGV